MADIRCQVCGKLNPAHLEVCQFCQASLRPAWSSSQPEGEAAENEDAVPEWLRSLRGPEPPEPEGGPDQPAGGSQDWLSGLEGGESFEPGAVSNVFNLNADEKLDDWLSGATTPGESEAPASGEEVPDQAPGDMQNIGEFSASPTSQEEDEDPDWLERIRERQRFEAAEEAGPSSSDEPAEMPSGEVPEWLSRMPEVGSDWMGPEQPEGNPPDWGEGQQAGESQGDEGSLGPVSQDNLPDWLAEEGQIPAKLETTAEAGAEELDSSIQPASASAHDEDMEGMPDWLTSLYSDQEMPAAPSPSIEEPAPPRSEVSSGTDFPAWLSGSEEQSGETKEGGIELPSDLAQPVEEEPRPVEPQEAVPDWLTSLETEGPGDVATPSGITPAFSGVDMASFGTEDEIPDWLTKLEGASNEPPAGGEPPAIIFKGEKVSPFAEDQPFEESPVSGPAESLPDWIAEVSAEGETPAPASETAESPSPLAQGQLPNWLEAMRPVESAAPVVPFKDNTDSRVESSGPLSGLSGVLPVGPHGIRPRKPAVFTIKLQVSEELQNRAMMLTRLIEEESQPKPIPAPALAPASYILRLVLFVLLVVGIILAMWTGGGQVQLPAGSMIPKGVSDAYQQISALPKDSAVLLAVDYEPGFAGELDGAAQAVVDHLIRQGAVVVAVSSTPNGAAMAERLFQSTRVQPEVNQPITARFQNLGYIPGGQSGLSGFARSPKLIVPYDLKGKDIWDTFPLQAQKGLGNFAMAVVITENADTARNWIEQVSPSLSPAPMLAVLSAQAEPMVLPYYAGNPQQIRGIVAGMTGGVSYEGLLNKRGLASKAWDSYSMTLTISGHVLLIGGLISLIYGSVARSRQSKVEGKA